MANNLGDFLAEVDGVKYYSGGVSHGGVTLSANIGYVDFSLRFDSVLGTWGSGGALSFSSEGVSGIVIASDSDGNLSLGGSLGKFQGGVIRYADGNVGIFAGAGLGGQLLGAGVSIDGTFPSSSAGRGLAAAKSIGVNPDGSGYVTQFGPMTGDPARFEPGAAAIATIRYFDRDGNYYKTIERPITAGAAAAIAGELPNHQCFAAGTSISLPGGKTAPIEEIAIGQIVLAFDYSDFGGRGQLVERKVSRLFSNVTEEFIVLDDGTIVTPGHHFLTSEGTFQPAAQLLGKLNACILADGKLGTLRGEVVRLSKESEQSFEIATISELSNFGAVSLQSAERTGWKTYNFEVEGLHTYVAGGYRVHNQSISLSTLNDIVSGNGLAGAMAAPSLERPDV